MKHHASPCAPQAARQFAHTDTDNGRVTRPFFDTSGNGASLVHPARLSAADRDLVEHLIDQLIGLLDAADGDPDFEPDADLEPSIGVGLVQSSRDLCTDLVDCELDDCDHEPWLGWTSAEANSGKFAAMADHDLEDEPDRELDEDFEWSLGWGFDCRIGQGQGYLSAGSNDLEADYCSGGLSDGIADTEPAAGWSERHTQAAELQRGRPCPQWSAENAAELARVVKFIPA